MLRYFVVYLPAHHYRLWSIFVCRRSDNLIMTTINHFKILRVISIGCRCLHFFFFWWCTKFNFSYIDKMTLWLKVHRFRCKTISMHTIQTYINYPRRRLEINIAFSPFKYNDIILNQEGIRDFCRIYLRTYT